MDERLAANRALWDERAASQRESSAHDVDGWLREPPGPRAEEVEALGSAAGLRLVHLQCHFGMETLAWARAGAIVTGLDFSPAAIDAARDLAARSGLSERATFVVANVYDATRVLERSAFDIVYVSLGSLCWLPSIARWSEQVGSLLAEGGRLYVHDLHPLALAMADDGGSFDYSYFEEAQPYADGSGPARTYQWNHGLGEIVTALTRQGLSVDRLDEHDWAPWPRFPWLAQAGPGRWATPPGRPRLPVSFSLLAHS